MLVRTIIPAHPGFHNPTRQVFFFHRHACKSKLSPQFYTTVSHVSGKVQLVEYSGRKDYEKHKSEVYKAIAAFHAGKPVLGCACKACN